VRIDAVVFDWGGTLTPWHTVDVLDIWRTYAAAYDPQDVHALAHRLHEAEEAAWASGRDTNAAATLESVLLAAGVDVEHERHAIALAEYEQAWEPHTWTDPQALPLLRGLRERGLRVGVLSNTIWSREYHERVLARDGVLDLVDGAVFSSEIAYVKPHPEAFRAALDAVGVTDAARAVFVGDRLFDDVHGAAAVGMRTVFVPHSEIPDHQRGHTEGTPDAVVGELREVLEVVDRWLAADPPGDSSA
jgi:putative hydrolase of the HAD superfamily